MDKFITKDYLLSTETAKELYSYAEKMPIIDYHCHLSPKEIYEDKKFNNITELWLGGDHYKWRLMRASGVEEKYITGDASDKEKFFAWAKAISLAIGNPLYEWSHIELKNYIAMQRRCLSLITTVIYPQKKYMKIKSSTTSQSFG